MADTSEWRSAVGEIAEESGISQYEVVEKEQKFTGDNFTTKIIRVQILEKEDGRKMDLFVKTTNMSKELRAWAEKFQIYRTEYRAYTRYLPALDEYQQTHSVPPRERFVYPKFYKGSADDEHEYMILEDLSCEGYAMYDKRKSLDLEHAACIVKHLARYHAASLAMKHRDPDMYASLTADMFSNREFEPAHRGLIVNLTSAISDHLNSEPKKKLLADFASDCENLMDFVNTVKRTEPYNIVLHGDFHINNMVFRKEEERLVVIFVDWQLMRVGCPASDLSQCLYMATDKQFRDQHLEEIFALYYSTLQSSLELYGCDVAKLYPRSVFNEHIIDSFPSGILSTIACCAIFLPNPGEENTLDAMITKPENLKIGANEEMIKRLEGAVQDIEKYKTLRKWP